MATEPGIQEPDTLSRARLDYSLDLDRLSPVFSKVGPAVRSSPISKTTLKDLWF